MPSALAQGTQGKGVALQDACMWKRESGGVGGVTSNREHWVFCVLASEATQGSGS